MSLGRRLIPLLFVGWALSVIVVIAAITKGYLDIALPLMGLASLLGAALLVTPAIFFLWYSGRAPAAVPQEMRRSALGSGASNLLAGILLAITMWWLGFGMLPAAAALGMTGLGVAVLARVFTLPPAPPASAVSSPGDPPELRHRAASVAGLATIVALIVLAPRAAGRPQAGLTEDNMRNDLRALVAAQDEFNAVHRRYGTLEQLAAADRPYRPTLSTAAITVAIESTRFIATAASPKTKRTCLVWSGTPVPPPDSVHGAIDGLPVCWER